MKDETYAFIEDVKERKSTARGAIHKKNGSKSKKCTLPSDYLTKKEREKMNGEVKNWNMNTFYTWDEFKEMPDDLKPAYISTISQKYNVSLPTIAAYQFNLYRTSLNSYFIKNKLMDKLKLSRKHNNSQEIKRFAKAVSDYRNNTVHPTEPKKPVVNEPEKPKTRISSMAFTMNAFDADIFNQIAKFFDEDNVTINIEVFRRV